MGDISWKKKDRASPAPGYAEEKKIAQKVKKKD